MSAKDTLLQTLAIAQRCILLESLTSGAPADLTKNQQAAMLRQGLAVLIFSTTETFIRERTAELLNQFDKDKLTFSDLLPALQEAVTIEALNGIKFRMKMQDPGNRISWLVGELAPVVTTAANISKISKYSFAYSKSNIDENDVQDILKCFGIDSGWDQITHMSSRAGISILNCKADFIAMKKRRHACAHTLTSNITSSDIENSINSALAICLGFDLLLTQSIQLHNLGKEKIPKKDKNPAMTHSDAKIGYLKTKSKKYTVYIEDSPTSAKKSRRHTFESEIDAWNHANAELIPKGVHIIQQETNGKPIDWKCSI